MEFRDLKQQYQLHKKEINLAMQKTLDSAAFIGGREVKLLEKALAQYVGVNYCITCANGTDALQLALMTWGVGTGDAVFVPDLTFFSSGEVVSLVGAVPVFVDVDADTYNISPDSLAKAVEYTLQNTDLRPKAVVAVDLFGQPADYELLRQVTDKYNLLLLEDSAQGFGGRIGEKRAGSFGDISTTSFFPAKPLGCYGDGGAIFTDNGEWAALLRSYCVHGKGDDKYDNVRIGMNSRLDTIQAAVLLEKLKFFDDEVKKCNCVAEEYSNRLKGLVKIPTIKKGFTSSWAQYTICFRNNSEREIAQKILKENNIPTAVYYKKPMHRQEAFAGQHMPELDCSTTENICECCLSLPMHSYLSIDEIRNISDKIKQVNGRKIG